MVEGRPEYRTKDELRPVADGRIYTPSKAVSANLADGVAYLDEVIAKAKRSAGLAHAKVITYNRTSGHNRNIYSKLPLQLNLLNINLRKNFGVSQPGFHYLWMPVN